MCFIFFSTNYLHAYPYLFGITKKLFSSGRHRSVSCLLTRTKSFPTFYKLALQLQYVNK